MNLVSLVAALTLCLVPQQQQVTPKKSIKIVAEKFTFEGTTQGVVKIKAERVEFNVLSSRITATGPVTVTIVEGGTVIASFQAPSMSIQLADDSDPVSVSGQRLDRTGPDLFTASGKVLITMAGSKQESP